MDGSAPRCFCAPSPGGEPRGLVSTAPRCVDSACNVPNDTQPQGGDRFPATRWSVIDAAHSGDSGEREMALATLFAAYWKPVYKYVRLRWNRSIEDAQDLTQGFFAELLDRDLFAQYDPGKSRLRTFLRVCVDSFVMNQDKAAQRQKRGGNVPHVALEFQEAEGELREGVIDPAKVPAPQSMEEFLEKEWIRSLFTLAIDDLRKHCAARQRKNTFLMFEEYDLDGDQDTSYDQLAQKYGIPTTDVTNALSWARREFRRLALERLREVCGSQEEFQREVLAVFGRKTLEAAE